MSKLAQARAEAAHLYMVEHLEVVQIAARMGRSVEGAELLLRYGGVDLDAPRAAAAAAESNDGSGPNKDDRGNCQPREKGPATPPAGDSIRQVYSPSAAAAPVSAPGPRLRRIEVVRTPKAARKPTVVTDAGRFVRMKPLNDDIVRWSAAYAARGVAVEYLADIFDVDVQALGDALRVAA